MTEAAEAGPTGEENGGKKKGRTARRARRAMTDAAERGDVRAAKAIGKSFLDLESVKERIKDERAKWKTKIDASSATLRGAIEQADDNTPAGARSKLNEIVLAWQEVEEAEAGRKSALHLMIEERKEMDARLRKQIEGAKQLGLFDEG